MIVGIDLGTTNSAIGIWQDGRAVAQTVRSAAWRYMTRTPPFEDNDTAEEAFTEALRAALEARPDIVSTFTSSGGTRQITPDMRAERGRVVRERIERYRKDRIADQIDWYRRKGRTHARRAVTYFWLALAAQVAAIGVAVVARATIFDEQ